jgi:hypothetical protein
MQEPLDDTPESETVFSADEDELNRIIALENIASRVRDDGPGSAESIFSNGMGTVGEEVRRGKPHITEASWKEECEALEKELPKQWRQLYPRIYRPPSCRGEFFSPKVPGHVFLERFNELRPKTELEVLRDPFLLMMNTLIEHAMPQMWISKEMADAIKQTTPPIDLDWTTMQLPFPAMIFMLPRGAIVHPKDGDVRFLAYYRLTGSGGDGSQVIQLYTLCNTLQGSTFLGCEGKIIPRDILSYKVEVDAGASMTTEDNNVQKEALHLIFGALLVMAARPNLVTEPQLINRVPGKKREAPKEFWSCRVLGENYKIRREHVDLGGHHSSPRFHWVRGHWRDQPHGPGRELRKLLWIEPFTKGDL